MLTQTLQPAPGSNPFFNLTAQQQQTAAFAAQVCKFQKIYFKIFCLVYVCVCACVCMCPVCMLNEYINKIISFHLCRNIIIQLLNLFFLYLSRHFSCHNKCHKCLWVIWIFPLRQANLPMLPRYPGRLFPPICGSKRYCKLLLFHSMLYTNVDSLLSIIITIPCLFLGCCFR